MCYVPISVCIPVYNRREQVVEAVGSALRQDYPPGEVVVIDNCSTDGTFEAVSAIDHPLLRVHSNSSNVGMFGNFNRCLETARGDYVRFLCSDDRLADGTLSRDAVLLAENPGASVLSTRCLHVGGGRGDPRVSADQMAPGVYEGRQALELAAGELAGTGGNIFNFPSGVTVRKGAAVAAGGFDSSLNGLADVDLWWRLLERGHAIFAEHAGCLVGEHASRASHNLFWRGLYMRGHFEVIERRERLLGGAGEVARMQQRMSGRCLWYALRGLLNGKPSSARVHMGLLGERQISLTVSGLALMAEFTKRMRRRVHGRAEPLGSSTPRSSVDGGQQPFAVSGGVRAA